MPKDGGERDGERKRKRDANKTVRLQSAKHKLLLDVDGKTVALYYRVTTKRNRKGKVQVQRHLVGPGIREARS